MLAIEANDTNFMMMFKISGSEVKISMTLNSTVIEIANYINPTKNGG